MVDNEKLVLLIFKISNVCLAGCMLSTQNKPPGLPHLCTLLQ